MKPGSKMVAFFFANPDNPFGTAQNLCSFCSFWHQIDLILRDFVGFYERLNLFEVAFLLHYEFVDGLFIAWFDFEGVGLVAGAGKFW